MEIRIFPVDEDQLRASVNITFDACFTVHDLQLIERPDGYLLRVPQMKQKDGTFKDLAFTSGGPFHQRCNYEYVL